MTEPLIWWTPNDLVQNKTGWPDYLKRQYDSRRGRNGRGRLWVDEQFGKVAVEPWPETELGKWIGTYMGGIVIRAEDAGIAGRGSGLVTDLALNIERICSGGLSTAMEFFDLLREFR